MKNIKVIVVGVGYLGREHARIYRKMCGVKLVGVVDIDENKGQEVANRCGVKWFPSIEKVDIDFDCASVVVPTDGHYSVAKKLIKMGKHILVEKPLASSLLQAKRLVSMAERKGIKLQVGHIERFNPIIRGVMDLLEKPRFIEIHRLSPFNRRGTEVGVILDLMIHDIDIVLSLVKEKVKRIDAIGVDVLTPFEDIANARITFVNECVANLTASRVSKDRMRKIRIFQENAYFSIDYLRQEGLYLYKENGRIYHKMIKVPREEPLACELKSFIDTIRKNTRPIVSGEDAVEAMMVAHSIIKKMQR